MKLKLNQHRVKEIYFEDGMHIIWKNGKHFRFSYWDLRTSCPCASCVNELTGEKMLEDSSISEKIEPKDSEYIGNYAIRIKWSDGHNTGLFSFKSLYEKFPHEELENTI